MKKILFLFLAYFAIAISNCTAQTVYITKTSSKYMVQELVVFAMMAPGVTQRAEEHALIMEE